MRLLERPGATGGVDIVSKRRASCINRLVKGSQDLPGQPAGEIRSQAPGHETGMDAGREQCLVGVDVPDAGDHRLVEQHRLQASTRAMRRPEKSSGERPDGPGCRIGTEPRPEPLVEIGSRFERRETAESTRISKLEPPSASIDVHDLPSDVHMVVGSRRRPSGRPSQLPAHPQLHDKTRSTVAKNRELLSPAIECPHRRSIEEIGGHHPRSSRSVSHDV